MAITTTKARLNLSIDSELIYISIKSDVIVKFHLNLKHEKI